MKKSIEKNLDEKPKKVLKPTVKGHTLFAEISPERYFVMCDGRQVKDYKELADVLQLINDDMFSYHVNDTKNDFANWINDVFKEDDLSKKIRNVHSRMQMSMELYKYLFEKLERSSKK